MNSPVKLRRYDFVLQPESSRVIVRPFVPGGPEKYAAIIGRALALSPDEAEKELNEVRHNFATRHSNIESVLLDHFQRVEKHVFTHRKLSRTQQLLIGAIFSGEYALESAALFNPSMVSHPDQGGLPEGALRFIMSLRATGEGHISSIEFRSGMITADGGIFIDPVSPLVTLPEVLLNPSYRKASFIGKLHEMGFENEWSAQVMDALGDDFGRDDLSRAARHVRQSNQPGSRDLHRTLEALYWLADSNYQIRFSREQTVSERIIFPVSANESNGIEDARFVRFIKDEGEVMYFATYTAYNGKAVLPQMIETKDFLNFRILTLNGPAVQNKGMALFPRRIGGRYAMLSRQDDENVLIMFADDPHHWSDPQVLLRPAETWECVKMGNCGSPIETPRGWLVLTHGVGPMRRYCIGAALLDLEDPTRVLGRLPYPLLSPEGNEREGYVPNVVYSCGGLVHNGRLFLPYAMSDKATAIVSMELEGLLDALLPPGS